MITDLIGRDRVVVRLLAAVSDVLGFVFRPIAIRREGRARLSVETDRITAIARAKAEARLIAKRTDIEIARWKNAADSSESIETKAAAHLRHTEIRKIVNVEAIVHDAVEIIVESDPDGSLTPDPLAADWLAQFFRYAENVSDEGIRRIWSTILARQSTRQHSKVSLATLDILRLLEPHLAVEFRRCIQFCAVFERCIDVWDQPDESRAFHVDHSHVQALEEIGFLKRYDTPASTLNLRNFALGFFDVLGKPKLVPCVTLQPSFRGTELASVFFPEYLEVSSGLKEPKKDIAGAFHPIEVRRVFLLEWAGRFQSLCDVVKLGFSMPLMDDVTSSTELVFTHQFDEGAWRELPLPPELFARYRSSSTDPKIFARRLAKMKRLLGTTVRTPEAAATDQAAPPARR